MRSRNALRPVPHELLASETAREALYRRSLRVVVACQVFAGAGLAAGITVGALIAQDMLDADAAAGLPVALVTLGSALAAYLVGRVSQVTGRRVGLGAGFGVGALGSFGVVLAALWAFPVLLFGSLFVYGAGTATNLQARYAGTDLAPAHKRGVAVSTALVATTLGAVAGPNLVEPLGGLAAGLGLPRLAGPILLAGVAYLMAGLVLMVALRPDPYLVARALEAERPAAPRAESPGRLPPGVAVGAAVMVVTQITMVAIMTMTPVHLRAHGHGLDAVGFVIGAHVAAMFLPSLVTGPLVDRVGRRPMVVASVLTLLAAGVLAALAPGDSLAWLTLALVLLGLGWNFGLIAGTAIVVDATTPATRARVQGSVDVTIALTGAGGGALSGIVVGGVGFAALGIGGGVLALLLLPVLALGRR